MTSEAQRRAERKYYQKNKAARREKKNAENRAWYAANKDHSEAWKLEWRGRNKERVMLYGAKVRARDRGLVCTITLADIIMPPACPLLGIPFVTGQRRKPVDGSPTLDRIDNSKGYIPGNVWVISYRANKIKNDATVAELFMIAQKLAERLDDV